ncbi:MAG: hypothetical protein F6K53_06020 [Moorea sp. SIO4A1]|uniref:hypothetical protein n=1 Tax=Moorena sp. SIO4A1 TaxID=2607835 RepID=UPI00144D5E3B|nr:hypothetical protein [Moorena sp. SIO4A1]NEQ56985.1 hypothetical protein [Moorena sp. SIO4A1]
MAKRPRNRVQPSTFQPSTLAKRPRNRVQPSTVQPSTVQPSTVQPWPKGHAIAFNLQPSTA